MRVFKRCFCFKFLIWFYYDQKKHFVWLDSYRFIETCVMAHNMFSEHMKRICILLLLGGMFFKCQWSCLLIVLFKSFINLLYFLSICSINYSERGVKVSNYNCGWIYISLHCYQFMFHIALLGAYTLRTVIASWWIDYFLTMK